MTKITIKIKGAEAGRQLSAHKLHALSGKVHALSGKGSAFAATKLGKGSGFALAKAAPHPIGAATPVAGGFKMGAGSVTKTGTIWSGTGTSLGLGVGLGVYGPLLLMAALGLVATGIYIYIRSQSVQHGGEETVEA